jgi:hypothetical protein
MKYQRHLRALLPVLLLMFSPAILAQAAETAPVVEEQKAPVSSGQEVEINEDNYRQFMELRDPRQQRSIMPEDAFKPASGSQKLDELPEESQKHLRNQLREIIVRGDQWKPGDEGTDYPYVPSEAAAKNSQLQQKEAEAWGELVDSYHKREAQIFENSARTQASMASDSELNGNPGGGQGEKQGSSKNSGAQGESSQQSEQQSPAKQNSEEAGKQANTSNVTSSSSSAGVSQNAMEFLQRMGKQQGEGNQATASNNAGQPENNASSGPGGPGEEQNAEAESGPGGKAEEQNQVTQQNDSEQSSSAESQTQNMPNDPNASELAGTSQNALEFLQQQGSEGENSSDGDSETPSDETGDADELAQSSQETTEEQQNGDSPIDSSSPPSTSNETRADATSGIDQNALEYLIGQQNQPNDQAGTNQAGTTGTLSIGELRNARGTGNSEVVAPPVVKENDEQSGGSPPDKDGDG